VEEEEVGENGETEEGYGDRVIKELLWFCPFTSPELNLNS
jgi:hypothetical protein